MSAQGSTKAEPNGDPGRPQKELSTGLWLLKHTQGIVTTATAIGILHLRTSHVIYFTVGTLATSFTAKGLKRVIKQPRPPGSKVKKTSGMPSTHSSTISFMGTYILLSSLLLPLHPSLHLGSGAAARDNMAHIWIALVGVVAPVLVMWSRVQLGVHTPAQTLVGAALGVVKACLWFTAWNGTQVVFGTSPTIGDATSASVARNGLRTIIGARVDPLIAQTEARVLGAIGR
ncbi:Phosphatidic acid phosphatase type 2/haloperoxidase [Kalmanozyma brasiliensis GHG001]|uniref:Phosphatidic acid phosphatase type 2/haloperoxidase domain-containing protein n=1 Tax=Kalmanozyma brasiliensis (strain GHG001) TaxID=1365824 RepID=V5EU71_KALBG|nr:Phosphatidic acid phosphatase type 2/haloperoxidase [Kalmanozyma brasiliensis GHG001]EST06663.1 Phosphatidic acid phosphatase type 2/haloperoxidase [Kalmanozyma brasiliensis GHG001]